jgi:hypothetical protein
LSEFFLLANKLLNALIPRQKVESASRGSALENNNKLSRKENNDIHLELLRWMVVSSSLPEWFM